MANNTRASSRSQLSHTSDEDNSSDHYPRSFATLSGGGSDSIIGSGVKRYPSLSNHNNNQPPPTFSVGGGYYILPREPMNNQPQQALVTPPSKRPRGRPPGSKNKHKPPIVIKQESEEALKPVVIEITAGNDVVEALITFARHRHVGISVLSGSGSVSEITLRDPMSCARVFPIRGPFNMLSLTGTYISCCYPPLLSSNPTALPPCSSFGICLAGSQGQVFGGIVGGKVIAATLVVVMATIFKKPEFHRVPFVDEEGDQENNDDDNNTYAGVINADRSGVVISNGINITNNNNAITMIPNMPAFSVANSTQKTGHVPVADMNVMQWNYPTHLL